MTGLCCQVLRVFLLEFKNVRFVLLLQEAHCLSLRNFLSLLHLKFHLILLQLRLL